jgi:hypothetical protein
MEPPCPIGECYLYAVVLKEHAESTRAMTNDPEIARDLATATLAFRRGPYTEDEPWDRTKLGLLNAVLDTLVPGARLTVESSDTPDGSASISLGRTQVWPRPRELARSLRELADCLDSGS